MSTVRDQILIMNGMIISKDQIVNVSLNMRDNRRYYVCKINTGFPEEFIKQLKEISLKVESIIMFFENHGKIYDIEIHVYMKEDVKNRWLGCLTTAPCRVNVKQGFYDSLLNIIKKGII